MSRTRQIRTTGLTISQLLKNTPPYVRNAAGYVTIRALKQRKDGVIVGQTRTNVLGEKARLHEQRLELINGKDFGNGTIRFNCDCEFYLYVCEVPNFRHGAAKILLSNGEPTYQTNPRMIPMLCKHGLIILERLRKVRNL